MARAKVRFNVEQVEALEKLVHSTRVSADSEYGKMLRDSVFKNMSNQMRKNDIYGSNGIGIEKEDFEDFLDDVRMSYSRSVKVAYPQYAKKGQLREVEFESIVMLSPLSNDDVVAALREHFVEGKSIELSKDNKAGLKGIADSLTNIHAFRDSIVEDEMHRKFMNVPENYKKIEASKEMTA